MVARECRQILSFCTLFDLGTDDLFSKIIVQLGYEQTRRATETAQAEFIRTFLNDSIVLPSCPTQNAITQTRTLTHAGSAVLLDLRLFKLSGGDQEELLEAEGNPDWSPPFEPKDYGRIKLLATDGDVDWEQIIRERGEEMLASTSRCLRGYAEVCYFCLSVSIPRNSLT